MEKPPGASLADIDSMLAEKGDRVVTVGYKKAFMPAVGKVREIIEFTDEPIRTLLAQYPVSVPKNGADILRERKPSDWLANGCHPLSFLLAVGGSVNALTTHHARSEDSVVILEFASGAVGTLHSAMGARSSQPAEVYTIYAQNSTLIVDNCSRVTYQRGIPFVYSETSNYLPPGLGHGAIVWEPQNGLATLENKALFTQGFYGSLRTFCDQVFGGTRIHDGSLDFARAVTAVYEAALRSEGKRVSVASA